MAEYTVSVDDIKNYLATEPENVGTPRHARKCLAAMTLRWKYPLQSVIVGQRNRWALIDDTAIRLPEDVTQAANKFDDLRGDWDQVDGYENPVTIAEVRAGIPELA